MRVKRVSNDVIEVTRLVEPVLHPNENRVEVNYHVFIRNKSIGQVQEVRETHHMSYLFAPEIEILLKQADCKVVASQEWMTNKPLGTNTWGACFMGISN